jgi:hypothetical protein
MVAIAALPLYERFMLGGEHGCPYVPEDFDRKKETLGRLAHRKVLAVSDPPEKLS